jgi:hypothetical protein
VKLSPRKIAGKLRTLVWDRIEKERDLSRSANVPTDSLQTVCLTLGPYRNLTTLTASVLFLHPRCQVLNHAGGRIFGDERIDFLAGYSEERFQTFLRYALHASTKGRRGSHGGSIKHSHAVVERSDMSEAIAGMAPKDEVTCLLWKESLRTSNHIRDCGVDLADVLAKNAALRFLMPVRNPLDCAASNIRKGHVRHFEGLAAGADTEAALTAILDEFVWFRNLQEQHGERFFHFFAHDEPHQMLTRMAAFLQLEAQQDWLEAGAEAFQVSSGYDHATDLVRLYREMVESKFGRDPEFAQNLLAFVGDGP